MSGKVYNLSTTETLKNHLKNHKIAFSGMGSAYHIIKCDVEELKKIKLEIYIFYYLFAGACNICYYNIILLWFVDTDTQTCYFLINWSWEAIMGVSLPPRNLFF